ncbi:aldehyde dehydrogenase family protein, partial [Bacillus vallismortis]|nr:aldehyde dehydrogenase family protein [Bacillus vallismortis]
ILEKAVKYIEENEESIFYLILEDVGGTRLLAAFEIGLVKNIINEAATFQVRMDGNILPSTIDGKENGLFRVPAGVVGVISP